jgi:hypothetical protein
VNEALVFYKGHSVEPMGDPYSMELLSKIFIILPLIVLCVFAALNQLDKEKHHSSQKPADILVVTPSAQRYYTIKVAGLVFHTTDYSYNKDDDSLRFIDDTGENVVIFAPKDVIILDDSK